MTVVIFLRNDLREKIDCNSQNEFYVGYRKFIGYARVTFFGIKTFLVNEAIAKQKISITFQLLFINKL